VSVPDENDPALASLVERAIAGEEPAESELYERFRTFVRRRVTEARARRNWFWLTDIDSAVQEVFTQFFKALRGGKFTYEGRRRLEGFLLRTAFFVAMNLKDKAREERHLSLFDDEEGGLRFDVAAFAESVYDQLERRECLRLLAEAIATLNENRREVVERTLLGQKVRDIVAATGRSSASVSGLKFNAMVELRTRLSEVGFIERCGQLFRLEGSQDT
jgi:RNA polymerase sigma factor (sigma-70 family)